MSQVTINIANMSTPQRGKLAYELSTIGLAAEILRINYSTVDLIIDIPEDMTKEDLVNLGILIGKFPTY